MQINSQQLQQTLSKEKLSPVYLVSGDEPLLQQEACDAIRAHLRSADFPESKRFQIEAKTKLDSLYEANNLSLFSEKSLLELHVQNKPTRALNDFLDQQLANHDPDQALLISTPKLSADIQKKAWYKQLTKTGLVVSIWPVKTDKLASWLNQRLQNAGFKADKQAIEYLIERIEGNLLAAQQTIEKLGLLFPAGVLSIDMLEESISNHARYDIFALSDAALSGDAKRCATIFNALRAAGVEKTLLLWAIARELRTLIQLKAGDKVYIWESRKRLYQQCSKRLSLTDLYQLLKQAQSIDEMIKGVKTGDAWEALLKLSLTLTGLHQLMTLSA